jgi:hypothetical protein
LQRSAVDDAGHAQRALVVEALFDAGQRQRREAGDEKCAERRRRNDAAPPIAIQNRDGGADPSMAIDVTLATL